MRNKKVRILSGNKILYFCLTANMSSPAFFNSGLQVKIRHDWNFTYRGKGFKLIYLRWLSRTTNNKYKKYLLIKRSERVWIFKRYFLDLHSSCSLISFVPLTTSYIIILILDQLYLDEMKALQCKFLVNRGKMKKIFFLFTFFWFVIIVS